MTTDEFADEILGRCRERIERGESVDPEEVIRAHPEIGSKLRDRFAALALLDVTFARATTPPPEVPSLAGRRLGRYRLEVKLGEGGMGTVWLATSDDGARVAVKVLHPHLAPRTSGPDRFLREAELGRRVRHENVVRTLDAGEHAEGGTTLRFLVMEHVEGRTLRALCDESGKLPEELCRHVGREIAKGLAAVHAEGAVHRDLKPENVMITREHVVKVMDLGVARVGGDAARLSQTGAFVGSLHYAAPEQLTDAAEVDARADLHALGVLLYELATGVHPFAGGAVGDVVRRILDDAPRRVGAVDPQISPLFEELLAQLLEKDREKRPASAADVAAILALGEASAWWHRRAQEIRAATHRPLRRIRIARETAIFGRDAELARLRSIFERAKAGDGQAVLIEGEAGIGKSRLVDEFVLSLWAAGEEIDFLFGSWPPGGAATASGALATAYREHFGDEGLEDVMRERLGAAGVLAPAFAALLSGLPPPAGAEPLTKGSLATCLVHVTRSLAAERTTIVLADDLHFAPPEGRALFESLALAAPGHRILLVGTARPEIDEKWVGEVARAGATRLALPRLGAKDLVALLRDALRSEHLAGDLAVKIAEKSDGNPYFVFEILRGLREGRFITRRADGTWVTTREIREIEVPPSIVEVVQARVGDLARADRDVLEAAACAGFEFDAAIVGDVLRVAPIPLLQRLGAIEKAHRLVRSVGRRFVFDHHQVMEVLYAGLSEPLREAYHFGIAEAIESRHGAAAKTPEEVGGAVCVDLAEQFLRGGAGPRALRYLDAALAHVNASFLANAVVRLTDRALAASGLLAGARRCEMLLGKMDSLELLGRREEHAESLREARELAATDEALRAKTLVASSRYFIVMSRLDDSRGALEEAISLYRKIGDRGGEAKATTTLGDTVRQLGRLAEARTLVESGIAMSKEAGDGRTERNAIGSLGIIFFEMGLYAEAGAEFERVRAMYRENGDRRSEAIVTGNLGTVLSAFGRVDEAIACYERCIALDREFGDRMAEASVTGNLGNLYATAGRYDDGRVRNERQLVISREIGDRRGEAIALVNLGQLWLVLGRHDRSRDALEASLALCRELGTRYPEGYALNRLAQLADEEGDPARALRFFEEALALRRSVGHADGIADTLLDMGDVLRRSGDLDGARAALTEGMAMAKKDGRPDENVLGLVLLACLPGGDAAPAIAALAAHPGNASADVCLLLWQATNDRAHLVEAKRLLDGIVALAPAECRAALLANVRCNREIVEAARANNV